MVLKYNELSSLLTKPFTFLVLTVSLFHPFHFILLGNNIKTDAQLNESNVSASTGLDREIQTDRFM
jgi:hypothetical protein